MKIITALSTVFLTTEGFTGGKKLKFPDPIGYGENYQFDFAETDTESSKGWSLNTRCGQQAIAGSAKDQRNDLNCPNVLLINTDDMAWGDVSVNNPSKLVPTPNIDRLVSKGINFRDGHACTARCAPSRYCLMTGRYHFRRGDYHYKPIVLEYGRKILPQLFKRNNYHTMVVGKPQPVEAKQDGKDYFFIEGTRFWGYDRSYTSRSYCCRPGGGYFVNDQPLLPFNRWAIFTEWRDEDERSLWVQDKEVEKSFYDKRENWHFLDGYYAGGDPNNEKITNTYKAYWAAIEHNTPSGLNNRRRRDASGHLIRRLTRHNRRRRSGKNEKMINEVEKPRKTGKQNYVRFMEKTTGKVIVANYRLKGMAKHIDMLDRSNYEFAVNQTVYNTKAEAQAAKEDALAALKANGIPESNGLYKDMKSSVPKKTQDGYDSREILHRFHSVAIDYLTEHVEESNPITTDGDEKTDNKPFFLYLSFRAPHRPYSHNLTYDPENPTEHLPHASIGKPGEQFSVFDEYVGNVMKTLHDLEVADNTLIFFTSDNGPDQGAFQMANRFGHMRMATMRGKKASVYEGGHRVPFLSWWPKGIHRSNWGTNYDLPVGQIDLFSTFADIMNYPLPGADKCIYAFNSDNAHLTNRDPASIGRPAKKSGESGINYCKRVNAGVTAGNGTYTGEDNGYDTAVQIRMVSTGQADYLLESQDFGYENVETWRTKEEQTGFILGWDGCMAEDSQSFAGAFSATKIGSYTNSNGEEVHRFKNSQDKVPSKIFAGKLGDLSLRLGRYKLVRFNPPKDFRTGPSRQHLINHAGPTWEKAEEAGLGKECQYDSDGNKLNPDCDTEKYCRDHTTFGKTYCMRDHYFQLWDLEKNFGEKTLCGDNGPDRLNPNHHLEKAIMGGIQERKFSAGVDSKPAEKDTDKYGIGCGVESSPHASYLNDCCVLNLDERDGFMQSIMRRLPSIRDANAPKHNCANMRFKRAGVEMIGSGACKKVMAFERQAGLTWETNQAYFAKVEKRFLTKPFNYARDYNWTSDVYFNWPEEGEWTPGYACGWTKTGFPSKAGSEGHQIFDESINEWRTMTIADRFCWEGKGTDGATTTPAASTTQSSTDGTDAPTAATTTPPPNTQTTVDPTTLQPMTEFTLGCKVPEHNGPLGEGFVGNEKWKADGLEDRHKPNVANGEIDPADFGQWFDFAKCMKNVMHILEGQAYFPEVLVEKTLFKVGYSSQSHPEMKPHSDDGSATGLEQSDDDVLAGRTVGDSKMAKNHVKELFRTVKDQSDPINTQFHGAGSRFIESQNGSDSLVGKCAKFLPDSAKGPYEIKPNFDIQMERLGWYNTDDESGGGSNQDVRELVVESYNNGVPQYRDDRTVQRYYQPDNNGAYLYKFDPQYHPSY